MRSYYYVYADGCEDRFKSKQFNNILVIAITANANRVTLYGTEYDYTARFTENDTLGRYAPTAVTGY